MTVTVKRRPLGRRSFLGLCAGLPLVASCNFDDSSDPETFRSTSAVTVLGPAPGQTLSRSQHCSVSTDFVGLLEPGDQIRVWRTPDEYALYTVVELRAEIEPGTLRMTASGQARLAGGPEFAAELDTIVAASHLTDAEAKAQSEFVERLVDDGQQSQLLVAAAHGGKIEAYTDRQAEHIAAILPGVSSWVCKGWRSPKGAFSRWHITSTELSPRSLPGLAQIADRQFTHVVSFHGMSTPGVLVGGRAPVELRQQLRDAIVAALDDPDVEVTVSGEGDALGGVGPTNFVNWLSRDGEGGIQIEQSYAVRKAYWAEIADAIASVLG